MVYQLVQLILPMREKAILCYPQAGLIFARWCIVLIYLCSLSVMASPGQKQGICGHIMALFDAHSKYARCRETGLGTDNCVQ